MAPSCITSVSDSTFDIEGNTVANSNSCSGDVPYRGPLKDALIGYRMQLRQLLSPASRASARVEYDPEKGMKDELPLTINTCSLYVREKHTRSVEKLMRDVASFTYSLTDRSIAFDSVHDASHPLSPHSNGLDASCLTWEAISSMSDTPFSSHLRRNSLPVTLHVDATGLGRLRLKKKSSKTTRPLIAQDTISRVREILEYIPHCCPTIDPGVFDDGSSPGVMNRRRIKLSESLTLHCEGDTTRAKPIEALLTEDAVIEYDRKFYMNRVGFPLHIVSVEYATPARPDGLGRLWKSTRGRHGYTFNGGSAYVSEVTYLNVATPLAHVDGISQMLELVDRETKRINQNGHALAIIKKCMERTRRALVHAMAEGVRCAFTNEESAASHGVETPGLLPKGIEHLHTLIAPILSAASADGTSSPLDVAAVHDRVLAGVLRRLALALTFYEIVQELDVILLSRTEANQPPVLQLVDDVRFDPKSQTAPFDASGSTMGPVEKLDPGTTQIRCHGATMSLDLDNAAILMNEGMAEAVFPDLSRVDAFTLKTMLPSTRFVVDRTALGSPLVFRLHDEADRAVVTVTLLRDGGIRDLDLNAITLHARVSAILTSHARVVITKTDSSHTRKKVVDLSASDIHTLAYDDNDRFKIAKSVEPDEPNCVDMETSERTRMEYNASGGGGAFELHQEGNAVSIDRTDLARADVKFKQVEALDLTMAIDVLNKTATTTIQSSDGSVKLVVCHVFDIETLHNLLPCNASKGGSSVMEGGPKLHVGIANQTREKSARAAIVSNALRLNPTQPCNIFAVDVVASASANAVPERPEIRRLSLRPEYFHRVNSKDRVLISAQYPPPAFMADWARARCERLNLVNDRSRAHERASRPLLGTAAPRCALTEEQDSKRFWNSSRFVEILDFLRSQAYLTLAQINELLKQAGKLDESQRTSLVMAGRKANDDDDDEKSVYALDSSNLSDARPIASLFRQLNRLRDKPSEIVGELMRMCASLKARIEANEPDGVVAADQKSEDETRSHFTRSLLVRLKLQIIASVLFFITNHHPDMPADSRCGIPSVEPVWDEFVNLGDAQRSKLWIVDNDPSEHSQGDDAAPDSTARVNSSTLPVISSKIRPTARCEEEAEIIIHAMKGVADQVPVHEQDQRRLKLDALLRYFHLDTALKKKFAVHTPGHTYRPFPHGNHSLDVEQIDPLTVSLLCVTLDGRPYLADKLDQRLFGDADTVKIMLDKHVIAWDRFADDVVGREGVRNRRDLTRAIRQRFA